MQRYEATHPNETPEDELARLRSELQSKLTYLEGMINAIQPPYAPSTVEEGRQLIAQINEIMSKLQNQGMRNDDWTFTIARAKIAEFSSNCQDSTQGHLIPKTLSEQEQRAVKERIDALKSKMFEHIGYLVEVVPKLEVIASGTITTKTAPEEVEIFEVAKNTFTAAVMDRRELLSDLRALNASANRHQLANIDHEAMNRIEALQEIAEKMWRMILISIDRSPDESQSAWEAITLFISKDLEASNETEWDRLAAEQLKSELGHIFYTRRNRKAHHVRQTNN